MAVDFGFASLDERYTLNLDDISVTTDATNTRIWERASKQGFIYGVYLQMDAGDRAVRLMADGREISIRDKTVAQTIAAGLDVPSPVFPYAYADDDAGVYTWVWTPRESRLAEYRDRAYIEVAAGVTVTYGLVHYSESTE